MTNNTQKLSTTEEKPLINFAHANGFPASSYQTLFNYFSDDYQITAIEKYGHTSQFPITNNWQFLVDELIEHVKQQDRQVIAIGHSFGAVISFIAACQQPQLFKGLIMLDPPAMTGILGFTIKMMKFTPFAEKFSPAAQARNRRQYWPADTDLVALYKNRRLFKNFDPRCLQDYLTAAMKLNNGRYELAFDADKEADIFRYIPTHLTSFKNKLTLPAALIHGQSSEVFPHKYFKNFVKKNRKIALSTQKGGHMFPLEYPKETAEKIKSIIEQWQ